MRNLSAWRDWLTQKRSASSASLGCSSALENLLTAAITLQAVQLQIGMIKLCAPVRLHLLLHIEHHDRLNHRHVRRHLQRGVLYEDSLCQGAVGRLADKDPLPRHGLDDAPVVEVVIVGVLVEGSHAHAVELCVGQGVEDGGLEPVLVLVVLVVRVEDVGRRLVAVRLADQPLDRSLLSWAGPWGKSSGAACKIGAFTTSQRRLCSDIHVEI